MKTKIKYIRLWNGYFRRPYQRLISGSIPTAFVCYGQYAIRKRIKNNKEEDYVWTHTLRIDLWICILRFQWETHKK